MTIGKVLRSGACLAILCTLPCLAAFSQTTYATLNGAITDANNAAIPQARITAQNTDTSLTETRQSNASGNYSISPLPPGNYRITAEQNGFKKYVETITLTVGQEATINFKLQIGSTVDTVQVNAGEVQLNTTNAEISNVVEEKTIAQLPLNGRDPASLVYLSPGVTNILNTPAGILQSNESMTNEQGPSAGGGQQGSTFALLDGIPNMDTFVANMAPFPNADATREFRAITNSYGAQYGFSPGAIISVDTKSGANAFHGGAFEFVRNGDLNASNYFTGMVDTLKRNQFGGFMGGRIIRDKLFFFANFQETRMIYGSQSVTAYTPTAAMLKGDFSAVPETLPAPFATVNNVPNQVDPSLFSKGAVAIANDLLPLGQDPATGQLNTSAPGVLSTYKELTARIDYTISSSQRLFARNFVQEYLHPTLPDDGNMVAASSAGAGEIAKIYNEAVSHTWLPTPKFVNVISAAWISNIVNTASHDFTKEGKPFCLSEYINVLDPGDCYMDGLYVGSDFSSGWYAPNVNTRTTWFLSDHTTTSKGNHIITAGVDFAHQWDNAHTDYPTQPSIYISGQVTGNALADYLLGDVTGFQQGVDESERVEGLQLGIYAQDEYKIKPNLTLTMGLRWEPDMAPRSLNGGGSWIPGEQSQRYPTAPLDLVFPGDPGVNANLRPSDYIFFMPRVGIAWMPIGPKLTLRAGFGMYAAPLSSAFYTNVVGLAPFAPIYNINSTVSNTVSFDNPWASYAPTGGVSVFVTPQDFLQNSSIPANKAVFSLPTSIPTVFATNFRLPETQSWTLSVEQQLTSNLMFHLAYVGSESDHQTVLLDRNPGVFADGGNRTTYPNFNQIEQDNSVGTASYNALQTGIDLRLYKGLTLQSNFTWSKTIDTQSLNNSVWNYAALAKPNDVGFSRGIASYNIPLVSVTNFTYESPALTGHSIALREIAGRWGISGIWTFQSGLPFGIVGGDGNNNSETQTGQDRGNLVPNQPWNVHQGSKSQWLTHYFNSLAFVVNPPGTFGNTGVDFLKGPGTDTGDLALTKNWQIVKRFNLQFRCEAFNAFNHPNFGQPANDPSSIANFGQITTIGPIQPRVLQLGMKLTF